MLNTTEPSSSISLASSHLSNGSSGYHAPVSSPSRHTRTPESECGTNLEVLSLSKLSSHLGSLLLDTEFDCTDAEIMVEGAPVAVHRCILAARSQFFHELFSQEGSGESRKPRYEMEKLVPVGRVGREAFTVFLSYLYTGKLKSAPQEVSICSDRLCLHAACRPAIDFAVELLYASSVFQITELISLLQSLLWYRGINIFFICMLHDYQIPEQLSYFCDLQRRLLNFVEKAIVEDVIPILQVASHSKLNQLLSKCVQRVARSDLDDAAIEKELPPEVADEIKALRHKSQPKETNGIVDTVHNKRIKRIHRALDCDDVELVKLLLSESGVTLDDACALHHAAAYCDSKVVAELLDLDSVNVNLKNHRGYTPLHVAAMRREPAIIVSLLTKGASAFDATADGQNAATICRRLTRAKDYYTRTEQGHESNKNKLCIDILEREMKNSMTFEDSVTSPLFADDLRMKFLYLENRVAFARLFFPAEAKLAMEIAHADKTSELTGLSASRSASNLQEVDLNETPAVQNKRVRSRVNTLTKTVDLGRRYFPHCSQVLDKFLENNLLDPFYLQKGTPDEQKMKKLRFYELKEDVRKAFNKDKAVSLLSGLSTFSSSSPMCEGNHQRPVIN